jgi:hypothetical protein
MIPPDKVPAEEIKPYSWLEKTLVDFGVRDIADMDKTRDECVARMEEVARLAMCLGSSSSPYTSPFARGGAYRLICRCLC